MDSLNENQLALVVSTSSTTSYQGLLDSQKELLRNQIVQLQNIVATQCNLTGVNPLSQEMAAGALSIKIGKRPRDLLNPKAIKYMQSVFSVKDEISKKDSRAISALFGFTATQVRDFFNGQRSRVRRFIRLSREKTIISNSCIEAQDGPSCSDSSIPIDPVPLNSVRLTNTEGPSCSMQDVVLPGTDDLDKYFVANIFSLMRQEESFSGQVTLLEWILQIQNSSVLYWFLTQGGVMILASWLSQAAIEEQSSVLHVILRVLCHLPLHRALPAHMSAILQSVNKLRFYRKSDISNRAKSLLSRWSKIFARSQAARKPNAVISPADAQDEMLLKQSICEIMGNESWESKVDISGETQNSLSENLENSRNLGSSQPMKLLTSSEDSNKKLLQGVSSTQTRERRKVQLVEQPGQKLPARSLQVARSVPATRGRPLSTDDIQKAKMRAQFMQSKYGKSAQSDGPTKCSSSQASMLLSASKTHNQPKVEEHNKPVKLLARVSTQQEAPPNNKINFESEEHKKPVKLLARLSNQQQAPLNNKISFESEEPLWKKCKMFSVPWVTPPEFRIKSWSVGAGENSKEVDVQNNRIQRDKGVVYKTALEILANPKDPWDWEIDYDDTLTPEIPTEQLSDNDVIEPAATEDLVSARECRETAVTNGSSTCETSSVNNTNRNMPEPDLELLEVLLRNPEVVIALTSGQAGNLSSEQMVKLLDMMKATDGVGAVGNLINGLVEKKAEEKVEVSLPSPTPSSNHVTSGWQPETAKNSFSRQQNVTVNGEGYAIPGVSFQEKLSRFMAVPQQQSPSLAQQPILHPSIHQRISIGNPNVQSQAPDMVPNRKNIPVSGPSQPFFLLALLPSPTRTQPQPLVISEPPISMTQPWTDRQILASNVNGNNYNVYRRGDFIQGGSQVGPSRVRNGYNRGEPGFESWSPDNSPARSQDYMGGPSYMYPGMNTGHSYRAEMSRPHNLSGYRDHGRNGNPRYRGRRS